MICIIIQQYAKIIEGYHSLDTDGTGISCKEKIRKVFKYFYRSLFIITKFEVRISSPLQT